MSISFKPIPLRLALVAVVLAVLFGCSSGATAPNGSNAGAGSAAGGATNAASDDNDNTAAADAPADDSDASAEASAPRVVKHAGGDTTIEGTPERIAVLDYRLADALLALGIKPYAMTTYLGSTDMPWIEGDELPDVVSLGDEVNLEATLEAEPDLIITRTTDEQIYGQLSLIAPTLIAENPKDWRESFRNLAVMLQKEAEAEEWLADYDARAAEVRSAIAEVAKPGETFMYLRVMPKEVRAHGPKQALSATLYEDLQLTPPPGVAELDDIVPISLEALPDFDPDYIFLEVGAPKVGGDTDALANFSAVTESAVWQNLQAVKNGHLYMMPEWIISDYPHIKLRTLDLIEQHLTGAAEQPAE